MNVATFDSKDHALYVAALLHPAEAFDRPIGGVIDADPARWEKRPSRASWGVERIAGVQARPAEHAPYRSTKFEGPSFAPRKADERDRSRSMEWRSYPERRRFARQAPRTPVERSARRVGGARTLGAAADATFRLKSNGGMTCLVF